MSKLIDVNLAKALLCRMCDGYNQEELCEPCYCDWLAELDGLTTVDAEPIKHGEWELYGNDDDLGSTYYCSRCNFQLDSDLFYSGYEGGKWIENNVFNYCPNCGAKMDGERRADETD